VTMWMSNVIFLGVAIVMLLRMGRTGGGTRDGGFEGLGTLFRRSRPAAGAAGSATP